MVVAPLSIEAGPQVQKIIQGIGRTEDIKFSPNNGRIAVIDFLAQNVFVFRVDISFLAETPRAVVRSYAILSSPCLRYPHGLCFLDDSYLVVANRKGDVSIFRLPDMDLDRPEPEASPLCTISAKQHFRTKVRSPGSIDSYQLGAREYRILVCNNYEHTVTSHRLNVDGSTVHVRNDGVVLERGLQIPDGISISPDREWVAVSNHVQGQALLYRNNERMNRQAGPTIVLQGIVCPHGIRFSKDGKRLFVADAASPYLHFFEAGDGWGAAPHELNSVRMMDDHTFFVGRYDSREGGIKGIDIDATGRILATTCRQRVLAFYDTMDLVGNVCTAEPEYMSELISERDQSLYSQRRRSLSQHDGTRVRAKAIWRTNRRRVLFQLRKGRLVTEMQQLRLKNIYSRQSVTHPAGPVLSLTSHGYRVETVFATIESIGRGTVKPSRMILWLDEPQVYHNLPDTLKRLRSRGLDIRLSENFGPHTKYFPYLELHEEFGRPLVTADDDILYPGDWLSRLTQAYRASPSSIHAFRVRRIQLNRRSFKPYTEWNLATTTYPSHLGFITGVSGVIYPPQFLHVLKEQGRGFEDCCPGADDIWLTVNALRAGFKIAQVDKSARLFRKIPGSQRDRLFDSNVVLGENHRQLMTTFSDQDLWALRSYLLGESKGRAEEK